MFMFFVSFFSLPVAHFNSPSPRYCSGAEIPCVPACRPPAFWNEQGSFCPLWCLDKALFSKLLNKLRYCSICQRRRPQHRHREERETVDVFMLLCPLGEVKSRGGCLKAAQQNSQERVCWGFGNTDMHNYNRNTWSEEIHSFLLKTASCCFYLWS